MASASRTALARAVVRHALPRHAQPDDRHPPHDVGEEGEVGRAWWPGRSSRRSGGSAAARPARRARSAAPRRPVSTSRDGYGHGERRAGARGRARAGRRPPPCGRRRWARVRPSRALPSAQPALGRAACGRPGPPRHGPAAGRRRSPARRRCGTAATTGSTCPCRWRRRRRPRRRPPRRRCRAGRGSRAAPARRWRACRSRAPRRSPPSVPGCAVARRGAQRPGSSTNSHSRWKRSSTPVVGADEGEHRPAVVVGEGREQARPAGRRRGTTGRSPSAQHEVGLATGRRPAAGAGRPRWTSACRAAGGRGTVRPPGRAAGRSRRRRVERAAEDTTSHACACIRSGSAADAEDEHRVEPAQPLPGDQAAAQALALRPDRPAPRDALGGVRAARASNGAAAPAGRPGCGSSAQRARPSRGPGLSRRTRCRAVSTHDEQHAQRAGVSLTTRAPARAGYSLLLEQPGVGQLRARKTSRSASARSRGTSKASSTRCSSCAAVDVAGQPPQDAPCRRR